MIAAHAYAAVRHGATPAEAIGVTFLMNGGTATVYGARAYAAFVEFYTDHSVNPPTSPAARRAPAPITIDHGQEQDEMSLAGGRGHLFPSR